MVYGLRGTDYRGRECITVSEWFFGLGSNWNISMKQQTGWDQVSTVLEALYLPARPHELKGSRPSQSSATIWGLSIQIHEPVGNI